jgi:hypothetical protein
MSAYFPVDPVRKAVFGWAEPAAEAADSQA